MRRLVLIVALAVVAALSLARSGGATFPGRKGLIVFASARPDQPGEGNSEIYELDAATGHSHDVSRTTAYNDSALAVSPDATRIAFGRAPIPNPDAYAPPEPRTQLWATNRDGSDQHRLGDVDYYAVSDIAWSGDGTRIAFLAASGANTAKHLWVVDADGNGLRELTDLPTGSPRWSPDGSELAFVGWNDPEWDIGVIRADGTGPRWLPTTQGTAAIAGTPPAWSPDGKELAFVEQTASSTEALVLVGADGSGARTLTSGALMSELQWLPSGEIGFLVRDSTDPRESDSHIELIRPDGSGPRTVASHVTPPVTWAPTGDRLAFVRTTARRELVVDSLDGSERVLSLPGLLARPGNELAGGPAWSPSGASIYVAGTVAPADTELYSITPLGGDLRQLTRDTQNEFDPAWSPNGRLIAFARQIIDFRRYPTSLWMMAADGSHPRRLAESGYDRSPSWAPDNVRLVFARSRRGVDEIAVLDTRSRRVRPLVSNARDPAWSPDGRLIAFASSGRRPLRLIRPNGTGERSLFDRRELEAGTRYGSILQPTWSPDGRRIAFTLFAYGKLSSFWERQLVVPRAGGVPRELSCGPQSAPPGPVRWSPDSTALVGSGGGEVWVCPLDGSPSYRLSEGADPDWQPAR